MTQIGRVPNELGDARHSHEVAQAEERGQGPYDEVALEDQFARGRPSVATGFKRHVYIVRHWLYALMPCL